MLDPDMWGLRLLRLLAGTAALVAALAALPAVAADNPNGFVRDRVSLDQTMADMLKGHFYEEVKCAEDCVMATRLVIRGEDAAALGFSGAKAGHWFEVGRREDVDLKAGVWTKVYLRLNTKAATRMKEEKTGLHIAGQVIANSSESGRYGWANWIRTCPWPRG